MYVCVFCHVFERARARGLRGADLSVVAYWSNGLRKSCVQWALTLTLTLASESLGSIAATCLLYKPQCSSQKTDKKTWRKVGLLPLLKNIYTFIMSKNQYWNLQIVQKCTLTESKICLFYVVWKGSIIEKMSMSRKQHYSFEFIWNVWMNFQCPCQTYKGGHVGDWGVGGWLLISISISRTKKWRADGLRHLFRSISFCHNQALPML